MAFGQTLDLTLGAAPGPGGANPASPERGGIPYSPTMQYRAGDIVTEGSAAYIAAVSNKATQPSASPAEWKPLGSMGGVKNIVKGEIYKKDELLTDGTNLYLVAGNYVASALPSIDVTAGHLVKIGADVAQTTFISTVVPASAPDGSLWYNLLNNKTYIKYNDGTTTSWLSL